MAATTVQTVAGNAGGYVQSPTLAFSGAVTGGNTIIFAITYNDDETGAVSSISDGLSNTYSKIGGGSSGGDTSTELWYAYNINGGSAPTLTVTMSNANYHDFSMTMREVAGLTTTDPFDVKAEGSTSSGTSHSVGPTATLAQANEYVYIAFGLATNSTFTLGSGFEELSETNGSDLYQASAGESKSVSATTGVTGAITSGSSSVGYMIVATFKEAASATLEQEGFAFGDDDGSESAHTLSTQDTNLTAALGVKTIRALIDSPDDPASNAYKLKYQKNGSGGYVDVKVGSVIPGSTGLIETGDITESGNNTASGSWAVSHPAAVAGDLLIFNIGWDDSTNTTGLTPPSGPNGESAVVIEDVTASDATNARGKVVYYVATGTWTASTLTFTPSASEQWSAAVIKVLAGEFDSSTPIGGHNALASTAAGNPSSPAITAGSSDGGGRVVTFIVGDVDNPDSNATGWTPQSSTDRGAVGVGVSTRDTDATDSESISSASGWTFPSSRSWVSFGYIVRPPADTTNEVYVSTSANVASGGEATTARLTAPSGKTSGSNFTTGRRWDDENGSDSIDIASNGYTELEWVLTTQSPGTTDDYYEFRVYNSDSALDTYTLTPKWTIGTSGIFSVNVSDSLSISESLSLVKISNISVFDSLTITENVAMVRVSNISVSDAVTITESQTVTNTTLGLSVADSLTVTESTTITNTTLGEVSVSDSLSITESANGTLALDVNVNDSIQLTESASLTQEYTLLVADTLTITESIILKNDSLGDISVADEITISENIESSSDYVIDVSDTLEISEGLSFDSATFINVVDSITTTDVPSITSDLNLNVSDTLTIIESSSFSISDIPAGPFLSFRSIGNYPLGMDGIDML